jgi:hypothetical protein
MNDPHALEAEAEEDAPLSQNERTLSEWLRKCDRAGAIPESRVGADVAYAMGHTRGLDEGRDAHLDSMRTLLMRILEAKGDVDEATLERIEAASLSELERWVFRLAAG